MSENELLDQIERYLNGGMNKQERAAFELLRSENPEVNGKVADHKQFISAIKQYGERLELESRLDAIHDEIDIDALEDELRVHPSFIVRLWRNHHSKISVAASIAIFAVLCTLFYTGYLSSRDNRYGELSREIKNVKKTTDQLNNRFNNLNVQSNRVGKFGGTGFAVSSNGYIVTDFHVIQGNDTVYVQNAAGESYKAKVIYSDPATDVAVLKIKDTSFKALGAIPYAFKKSETDIGENVFTVGYPRDAMVFSPGFLTASSGINGDTTQYQISTPVNFGNSGGPLLDNKGNLIGIIKAKDLHVEGAAFAVKSNYLLKVIQDMPDSLKSNLNINSRNVLASLNRVQQIKKMQNYIFMIRVNQ